MSRVLIIGASFLQLPAIIKAKELGHYVAVADYNPEAVGIPYADEYFNASTIDTDAILKVAQEFCPDGVMTLATDMPMRSVAAVAEALNLPGISMCTAIKATDKAEMIKAFKENNVSSPWYFVINNESELQEIKHAFSYPCIMKPTDNAGSRGVMLIHNASELDNAYKFSSGQGRSGAVIVEEYMTGKEVSVEIVAYKGDIHVLAVTDKLTTGAPHFVELGHNQPSALPAKDIEAIHKLAQNAVEAVGITDGPAHVEIMLTKDGPKMIELGARMGGDCITTHLVPLSTGIDMVKATIDISLGQCPDITPQYHKGSAIRFLVPEAGVVSEIKGVDKALSIPGVKDAYVSVSVGDCVKEIESSIDRSGYVIAQGDDLHSAIECCELALNTVEIITKS